MSFKIPFKDRYKWSRFQTKDKVKFKTESAYFKHTDKIADAFYDEDYEKLSKLLGKKVTNQVDAENYFNEKWKKKVVIGK